jgi:hypothetical protein
VAQVAFSHSRICATVITGNDMADKITDFKYFKSGNLMVLRMGRDWWIEAGRRPAENFWPASVGFWPASSHERVELG